jgi:hypothetical protein
MSSPAIQRDPESVRRRVAKNVRIELARLGISQVALARHVFGESDNASTLMSRRVRGRVPFRAEELSAIAEFLGVDVAIFYADAA